MFVRIKRRILKNAPEGVPTDSLRAYVVENRRINGKPRQHVVSYLACIRDNELPNRRVRAAFLKAASNRIEQVTSNPAEIVRLKLDLVDLLVRESGRH